MVLAHGGLLMQGESHCASLRGTEYHNGNDSSSSHSDGFHLLFLFAGIK